MLEKKVIEKLSKYELSPEQRVALLEEAVTDMSEMKTDVHTIKQLLEQGRGVVKTFQFIVWVLGPLIGLIYWWQEHVK